MYVSPTRVVGMVKVNGQPEPEPLKRDPVRHAISGDQHWELMKQCVDQAQQVYILKGCLGTTPGIIARASLVGTSSSLKKEKRYR